jgi:hypothetical protein
MNIGRNDCEVGAAHERRPHFQKRETVAVNMAEEHPSYYAIIPAPVRYHHDLVPMARLLYAEITALAKREGYCYARNEYFAKTYNTSIRNVRRWIEDLAHHGFISVDIDGGERSIFVMGEDKNVPGGRTNLSGGEDKNVRSSIVNNKSYILKGDSSRKFKKPTISELTEHLTQKGYTFSPERFLAHYEANGWRVGRNAMRSWQAACVTWQQRQGEYSPRRNTTERLSADRADLRSAFGG